MNKKEKKNKEEKVGTKIPLEIIIWMKKGFVIKIDQM